jgi:AcrR family transcriptional regulator
MSSSQAASGSRRDRAAQTEVALKEAARAVFARSGYLNAKITDITAEAGRSAGSFYQHFTGKEQVLQALLADWIAHAGEELAAGEAGDDLSREPALRARVAVYWRTYRAHLPEIQALGQAAMVDPVFAAQLARFRHAELQAMREHLERLRDAGFTLPGDPAVLASAFSALLEGFCAIWLGGGGEPIGRILGDDEAIDTLTGLLQHGLAGPRAAASRP